MKTLGRRFALVKKEMLLVKSFQKAGRLCCRYRKARTSAGLKNTAIIYWWPKILEHHLPARTGKTNMPSGLKPLQPGYGLLLMSFSSTKYRAFLQRYKSFGSIWSGNSSNIITMVLSKTSCWDSEGEYSYRTVARSREQSKAHITHRWSGFLFHKGEDGIYTYLVKPTCRIKHSLNLAWRTTLNPIPGCCCLKTGGPGGWTAAGWISVL